MSWTVAQIVSTFRELTGRHDSEQLSDADILIAVNHYYQYIFPEEANITEFKGWYTFNTVASTGSQAIPEATKGVNPPAYVDDEQVNFWTDIDRFYTEYPHDYTDEDVPSDILLFDRTLILRPIPDDAYEVRLRSTSSVPSALTTGTLDNSKWGPAIAYGSAIMFLCDQGEKDTADEHLSIYGMHMSVVRSEIIRNRPQGLRPRGGRF
jgi:hypothetical protein